jgi:hypothetical protein
VITPFGALGRILREAMRFSGQARVYFWHVTSDVSNGIMSKRAHASIHDFFLPPGRRKKKVATRLARITIHEWANASIHGCSSSSSPPLIFRYLAVVKIVLPLVEGCETLGGGGLIPCFGGDEPLLQGLFEIQGLEIQDLGIWRL